MGPIRKLLSKAQLTILLSFGVCVVALALTPPGTIILNRASVFYEILSSDEPQQSISNATTVAVASSYAFSVENTHSLNVAPGVVATFAHRIVNQGNTEDSYNFVFNENLTPFSDNVFDKPVVFLDINSNGRVEANEPVVEHTELLQPGNSVDVVVTARVSATLVEGQQHELPITVESELSDVTRSITDLVTVGSPGSLAITLSTVQSCGVPLFPGDELTHSFSVANTGFGSVDSTSYIIDGIRQEGVVVEFQVPSNTGFVGFNNAESGNVDGVQLVQIDGFSSNEWITAPAVNSVDNVTFVGFYFRVEDLLDNDTAAFNAQFRVNDNILPPESILNTAFYDADADGIADVVSNSTCNTFSSAGAVLNSSELRFVQSVANSAGVPDFSSNADFSEASRYQLFRDQSDFYSLPRDGVYLELTLIEPDHPEVLTDSLGRRYVVTQVESSSTGDLLNVVLLQTADPQLFRSIAPVLLSTESRADGQTCPAIDSTPEDALVLEPRISESNPSCVLQSTDNDQLRAMFVSDSAGSVLLSVASVNQQSVVFDSRSFAAVSGATIEFKLAETGELARDAVSGVSFSFVSDEGGRYPLPRLDAETSYYIDVMPPANYQFPSVLPPLRLTDFLVHGVSYGRNGVDNIERSGVFFGASINAQGSVDIPLDPQAAAPLLSVDKVAIRSAVDIGQSVFYRITVRNSADELSDVVATDTLPFGFRLVPGSVVVDGVADADPGSNDEGLQFNLGNLAGNETLEFTYAARPSAAAIDGNGVNTVVVSGFTAGRRRIESLSATAKVTVNRTGVFSDRAALFGKVYVDQNCDGIQNNKEWPIGGVRLYLNDGTFAITDADGLYSLYGLAPDQYVVQVDTHSLPPGLELRPLSVNQLADADSRLIRLSDGDFHRADFAAGCPADNVEQIFAEIMQRNSALDTSWYLQSAERLNNRQVQGDSYTDDSRRNPASADGDLSRGFVDAPDGFDYGSDGAPADIGNDELENSISPTDGIGKSESAQAQSTLDAQQVVATITQEQAKEGTWLWPQSSMSLNGRFMAVIRDGIDPTLYVNDVPVPSTHIGERMVNRREKAQVVAWYGVDLESGENTVEIRGKGPFGNQRVLATGVFKRPSAGTQIKINAESQLLPADGGRSTLPVTISILDDNGYPALGVYYITLESTDGHWQEPDIQDKEPGRQIRIENGKRTVYYRSSRLTGEVHIRASTGSFSDQLTINQVTESRPLLVSGFVEAGGYFSTEEIGNFDASTDLGRLDEEGRFDARAALFVKGTIKEKYNLTLSYDSDGSSNKQLLRDINPTLHYPVHGDASIRGFEAQSRSKLYVRVERDKSSVMWGDYITDAGADRRDLARQSRTLTGANAVYNDGKNTLRVFAASEENRGVIEEIRGNGSALQYRLRQYPIVPNSETVELITRSRDNPDLIIDTVRLSQVGDYSLDDELGFLSFAATVATLDPDQNPVFIRISYSVEQDGEDYLIAGARFDRAVGENLTFGASVTHDDHSSEGRNLVGVYGEYKISSQTRLSASLARSDSEQAGIGRAHSVALDHNWSKKSGAITSFTHQRADGEFSNAGSSVSAGRTETRLTHSQNLNPKTSLQLEANQSRSSITDDERLTVGASVETTLKGWKARAGLRQINHKTAADSENFVTFLLGASRKFTVRGLDAALDAEYEQDVGSANRRRVAAGAKLALKEDVEAYGRYEATDNLLGIASLSGDFVSESFTVGVESQALRGTRMYSEYRMNGAFEANDFESATGVRGDYEILQGLRISPHFEYIERIGTVDGDSLSASIGVTDTRARNSRRLIRLETRLSNETDHYGVRASVTSRLNNDWTGIISDNFSYQDNSSAKSVKRHSLLAGLARRPKFYNKHHMLLLYRLEQERGVIDGLDRTIHILSTHQNLEIDQDTIFSGRLGLKHDASEFSFNRVSDFSVLADARLSFDLSSRLNLDTGVGALTTDGISEIRYSMGLGLSYILNRNLQLSFAYNLIGFKDGDLDAEQYNAQGAHVGLKYKLEEELFKWLE